MKRALSTMTFDFFWLIGVVFGRYYEYPPNDLAQISLLFMLWPIGELNSGSRI